MIEQSRFNTLQPVMYIGTRQRAEGYIKHTTVPQRIVRMRCSPAASEKKRKKETIVLRNHQTHLLPDNHSTNESR